MKTFDNPGRERILDRIRTALRTPVEQPRASVVPYSAMFEPVADPLARFQQEAKANLMEVSLTSDAESSGRELATVLDSLPAGEIFVQDHARLRQLIDAARTSRPIRWSSQGAPSEASQATVSLVEAVIAQTGSILVSAACGGRGASVVAPCHIAVASVSQIVPDLSVALSQTATKGILMKNSFACVISGSSRTADIEKILVQGAHGPRRLIVLLEQGSAR